MYLAFYGVTPAQDAGVLIFKDLALYPCARSINYTIMNMNKNLSKIATAISQRGGRAFLVGGAVIDRLMGRPVKDWDVEVFGLELNQLDEVLSEFGTLSEVGKSFGIIKLKVGEDDFDFSLPRLDNNRGDGHKEVEVILDPNLTPVEAGRRRDLTINSMSLDVLSGEVIDPFNGLNDLREGIIRATDPETFVEDPLRVLRIMQLLPRKGRVVVPETIMLCQSIKDKFPRLSAERVFEEFKKLLLKAERPSMGLEFLRDSGWLQWFPELGDLIGCGQNPEWHPEGDVWVHTCMVLDNAAALRDQVPEDWRLVFMLGCLLHDVGKPLTTTPDLRSPGHAEAGVEVARRFMARITNNHTLTERVLDIVRLHMRPGELHRVDAGEGSWRRLHRQIRLDVLGFVSKADSCGRTGRSLADVHNPSELCWEWHERLGSEPPAPLVQGRDLIALGMKPGPTFGPLLARALELQMDGLQKEEILKSIL